MKKILMLEDDKLLGETIYDLLSDEGFHIAWAKDGEEALEWSYDHHYDLYLFDVNVPLLDGFELLQMLRDASDITPTLFMSARVDMQSISQGFKAGAFDYIKKPFYPEELLIRINAKIGSFEEKISYGNLVFFPEKKEVYKADKLLPFGDVQFALFEYFIHNQNQILSKEDLYDLLEHPSPVALRVALTKLKQQTGFHITNIRGIGYRLEPYRD
jgi:DNA-binding response OmpR family regulator